MIRSTPRSNLTDTRLPYTRCFRSADDRKLPLAYLPEAAPVDQRFLAAVRHPHFGRVDLGNGRGQFGPVGVVGDDERQFDIALPRALANAHPAACHGGDRIGQAARPAVRSEEHTSELQSLMRISYAVLCFKK